LRNTFEDKNTALIYGMVFYVFWVSHSLAVATKPGTSRKSRWLVRVGLIALIIPWAVFNNWVTLDLLGLGLAFAFAATMQPRVSFLRLTIVLMILAFVYDFVQVFITGNMVKAAENMMSVMNAKEGDLGIPFLLILPGEFSWYPASSGMLGLGDVVAALLIATAAQRVGKRTNSALPLAAVGIGFLVSVVLAYAAAKSFNSGQPALIYIVPICCGLVMLTAKLQGNFAELRRRAWTAPHSAGTTVTASKEVAA
jgi:presenilin-like A22 family membrane protease